MLIRKIIYLFIGSFTFLFLLFVYWQMGLPDEEDAAMLVGGIIGMLFWLWVPGLFFFMAWNVHRKMRKKARPKFDDFLRDDEIRPE